MAKYEITSPDGEKFEITAPDDATEQQIMQYAEQQFGGGQPEKSGFIGQANRAIADAVGYPLQQAHNINRLLGIAPEGSEGYQASEAVAQGLRNIRAEVAPMGEQPDTFAGRAGRLTGDAAAMLLPLGGLASKAAQGTGRIANTSNQILQSIAQNPGKTAAAEALGIAGAASGGKLAQEITGGSPTGEFIGELAGGVAAPYLAAGGVLGQASRAVRRPFTTSGAEKRAARRTAGTVDDVEAARSSLQEETISNLTPAQRVGTDEALQLERTIAESDPALRKAFDNREAANRQMLDDEAMKIGQGGDTASIRSYLEGRRSDLLGRVKKQADAALENATRRVEQLTPNRRQSEASLVAREEIERAYSGAKATESELWSQVPNAALPPVKTKQAYSRIKKDLPQTQSDDMPASALRFLESGTNTPLQGSVKELQGLRSKLLEEARIARAAGNNNTARIANELSDAILDDLGAAAGKASGEVGTPLRKALDYSRELNQTYRQGSIGKILGSDRKGADRVASELTLQSSVGTGGGKGAVAMDELVRAADTPELRASVADYMRDQLQRKAVRDGRLNPAAAERFIKANEDVLDRMPDVRDQLTEAVKAERQAQRATGRQGILETSLTKKNKSTTADILGAKVDDEVSAIFKSPDPRKAARRAASLVRRNQEAVAGLRSGVVENIMSKSRSGNFDAFGNDVISGNKMLKEMMIPKQRAAMVEILGEDGVNRLDRIARELAKIEKSGTVSSADKIIDDTPNKLLSILVRGKAATLGGSMGGGTAGGSLRTANIASTEAERVLRRVTGDRAERLLVEAAQDKDLYDALLSNIRTPSEQKEAARKFNLWLYSTGMQYPELFEEDE